MTRCIRRLTPESSAGQKASRLGFIPAIVFLGLGICLATTCIPDSQAGEAEERSSRLSESVRYLASDELGGRGIGTEGIDQAADHIAKQFAELGLKTELYEGTAFQEFPITTGAELGEENRATLVGPPTKQFPQGQQIELKLTDDFTPLAIGGSGEFDLPVVFVGYGITAKDLGYDDFEGIDVNGKAVIILRHEPQQENPHSGFNGKQPSVHAPFTRKVSNAYEHGAAAVIFLTDDFEIRRRVAFRQKRLDAAIVELQETHAQFQTVETPSLKQIDEYRQQVEQLADQIKEYGGKLQEEFDPVLGFSRAGNDSTGRDFPVLHCRRAAIDAMVEPALDSTLAELEQAIDEGPTPHSRELTGWKLTGKVTVHRKEAQVKNVVAVLEGDGSIPDETIVIGAHYDHLGMGGAGSLAPNKNEIHNGADDNASGTAALLEVARTLVASEKKLSRRVVFIAFTAEERGLLGSAHYVSEPLYPMDQTIAMLNMDMVGRLDEDKLIIQGVDTAKEFETVIDPLSEKYGFRVTKQKGGFGPSDHASFYSKQVPVMHFFTGTHSDYHRPSDDFDKVNLDGMRRVAEMVSEVATQLATAEKRPQYVEAAPESQPLGGDGDRPYFGSIPDFAGEQTGYALSGVTKDGPAEKGGLKAGDVIIKLGDSRIGNLEDFDSALRKYKAGDKVPVIVKRDGKDVELKVTLDPPR
jgi:hypothetical protein